MALTLLQKHQMINAAYFNGRIEAAVTKLAVYVLGQPSTDPRHAWARDVLADAGFRLAQVNTLRWYVLQNVAGNGGIIGGDATLDSDASDDAIQSEVDSRVALAYPQP